MVLTFEALTVYHCVAVTLGTIHSNTLPFIIKLQELCNWVLMLSSREFHPLFFIFFIIWWTHLCSNIHIGVSKMKVEAGRRCFRACFLFNVNACLCSVGISDSEPGKSVVPLCWSAPQSPAVALSCDCWSELMANSEHCVQYCRFLAAVRLTFQK